MQTSASAHHPPESAGRILTARIPVVSLEATIADIERLLVNKHSQFDSINYIYVVDRAGVLCGVLTIKSIFRVPKVTRVKDVMVTDVISARATVDQERLALLALRHNLKAIPVVDKEDHLLGVVASDTILSILHHESKEDLLLRAGVRRFDRDSVDPLTAPVFTHVKKRLPWLLVGLFGGTVGAAIISYFEDALAAELLLVAFIPALVYMADAVGTQSEMLFVHAASLQDKVLLGRYLKREFQISSILSLVLATALSLVAFLWFDSGVLTITIGLSLLLAVLSASMFAVILPWILIRLRRDPAVASGPFVTIFSDLLTITIYFLIAEAVMRFFA